MHIVIILVVKHIWERKLNFACSGKKLFETYVANLIWYLKIKVIIWLSVTIQIYGDAFWWGDIQGCSGTSDQSHEELQRRSRIPTSSSQTN